jgi:VWFA-related protein
VFIGVFLTFLVIAVFDRTACAQDEPIKLRSDLVTVNVSVADRAGRAVKSLKAEDFAVYEDGVRQKISHFAATEEPFSLVLLLDLSGSTRHDLFTIKQAAKNFIAELQPDDRVAVVTFSRMIEVIAKFGEPRSSIEAALDRLAWPEGAGDYRFTGLTGTSFYDALQLAVEEGPLKGVEGRKAIICMSDGVDSTSKLKYRNIARPVEQSEASVYFLELNTEEMTLLGLLKPRNDPNYINFSATQIERYFDEYEPDSLERRLSRSTMPPELKREVNGGLYKLARREIRELSERTGGRVYSVKALSDLDGVYKQVAEDLRTQYSIGYYPINESRDGRWRAIRIESPGQDRTVRARSGYWAPGK